MRLVKLVLAAGAVARAGASAAKDAAEVLASARSEAEFRDGLAALGALEGQEKPCGAGMDGALLGEAMERGFYETVVELIRACADAGVKVDVGVHQKANAMRKKISEVTAALQSAKAAHTVVAPAFEWAQSTDTVFLGVKFAHKLDAPACIDLEEDVVEIAASKVLLRATCRGKNKKFSLELDLLETIDPEGSSWTMASVGRGTFTLAKAEPRLKWERLLSSADKPRNMHTWWQLHEKYAAELDALEKARAKQPGQETDAAELPEEERSDALAHAGDAGDLVVGEDTEAADEADAGVEAQRKELRKRAKKDTKRVSKEAKKELKALEADTKAKLDALTAETAKRKEEVEAEAERSRERIQADKKSKHEKIQSALDDALGRLERGETEPSGAAAGLFAVYDKVTSMLFGAANAATEEAPAGGDEAVKGEL